MSISSEPIRVTFSVVRLRTLADGEMRVELAMPFDSIIQFAAFAQCQRDAVALNAVLTPVPHSITPHSCSITEEYDL
jgi:hypothetical protein